MNKKGFVATSILYTFLVVFMFLIATILANYAYNRNLLIKLSNNIKNNINQGVQSASPIAPINIKKSITKFLENSKDNLYKLDEYSIIDYNSGKWAEIKKPKEYNISYLWIPAFKYKIPDNYDFSKASNDIDIEFLLEEEIKNPMEIDGYKIPSAFKLWNSSSDDYRLISGFFIKNNSIGSSQPNLGDNYYVNRASNNQFEVVKYLQHSKYKTEQLEFDESDNYNCYIREWIIDDSPCNYNSTDNQYCDYVGTIDSNPWLENKPISEEYENETFNYYKGENNTKNFNHDFVVNYENANEINYIEKDSCLRSNYRYAFFKLEE